MPQIRAMAPNRAHPRAVTSAGTALPTVVVQRRSELAARGNVQLLEDVAQVGLHRVLGHEQALGNLSVGETMDAHGLGKGPEARAARAARLYRYAGSCSVAASSWARSARSQCSLLATCAAATVLASSGSRARMAS